jgi:hypothetical protein
MRVAASLAEAGIFGDDDAFPRGEPSAFTTRG